MPRTLRVRMTAQLGDSMEIDSPELESGRTVDVPTGSPDYCTKYGTCEDVDLEGLIIGGGKA